MSGDVYTDGTRIYNKAKQVEMYWTEGQVQYIAFTKSCWSGAVQLNWGGEWRGKGLPLNRYTRYARSDQLSAIIHSDAVNHWCYVEVCNLALWFRLDG